MDCIKADNKSTDFFRNTNTGGSNHTHIIYDCQNDQERNTYEKILQGNRRAESGHLTQVSFVNPDIFFFYCKWQIFFTDKNKRYDYTDDLCKYSSNSGASCTHTENGT